MTKNSPQGTVERKREGGKDQLRTNQRRSGSRGFSRYVKKNTWPRVMKDRQKGPKGTGYGCGGDGGLQVVSPWGEWLLCRGAIGEKKRGEGKHRRRQVRQCNTAVFREVRGFVRKEQKRADRTDEITERETTHAYGLKRGGLHEKNRAWAVVTPSEELSTDNEGKQKKGVGPCRHTNGKFSPAPTTGRSKRST